MPGRRPAQPSCDVPSESESESESHMTTSRTDYADFGSRNAFRELLGVRLEERGDGTATVVIDPVPEQLLQARGIVHGGVCATLVDCAGGEALRTALEPGEGAVTVDLNVTYLRPVAEGVLRACGRVLMRGRSVGIAVADVYDGQDRLVATGRASFAVRAASAAERGDEEQR